MAALAGFLIVSAIGVVVTVFLGRNDHVSQDEPPWNVSDLARNQITIIGGLAGFAITNIVLLVTLVRNTDQTGSDQFNTVIFMLMVSYTFYVGMAYLLVFVPKDDADGGLLPRVHFSLVEVQVYRNIFIGWFALRPLMELFALSTAAHALAWLLAITVFCGWMIAAALFYRLGMLRPLEIITVPLLGVGGAMLFALAIELIDPSLRSQKSALYLTYALMVLNTTTFASVALVDATWGLAAKYPASRFIADLKGWLDAHVRLIFVADLQVTVTILAFFYPAVVGII